MNEVKLDEIKIMIYFMWIIFCKWLVIDNINVDKLVKGVNCEIKLILFVKCLLKKCFLEFFLI